MDQPDETPEYDVRVWLTEDARGSVRMLIDGLGGQQIGRDMDNTLTINDSVGGLHIFAPGAWASVHATKVDPNGES